MKLFLSTLAALFASAATAAAPTDGPVDIKWTTASKKDCDTIVAGEAIASYWECETDKCDKYFPIRDACAVDLESEAARVFKDTPYSIIQVSKVRRSRECDYGTLSKLVARGDGECYPLFGIAKSEMGSSPIEAVRVKIAADNSVSWSLFKDDACKTETGSYTATDSDVKNQTCLASFIRVIHISPAAGTKDANASETPGSGKATGAASISTLGVLTTSVVLAVSAAVY